MNTLYGEELEKKRCVYCKELKPISEFGKHIAMWDNLDTRCKECISKRKKRLRKLRKFAPPKPENCECCGRSIHDESIKKRRFSGLVLDHNDESNTIRGWICGSCNQGIGSLGDTSLGLKKALEYLVRAENREII